MNSVFSVIKFLIEGFFIKGCVIFNGIFSFFIFCWFFVLFSVIAGFEELIFFLIIMIVKGVIVMAVSLIFGFFGTIAIMLDSVMFSAVSIVLTVFFFLDFFLLMLKNKFITGVICFLFFFFLFSESGFKGTIFWVISSMVY